MTVVIPTRDRWWLLASTLESALGQEDVDHEVVVVDDGSAEEGPASLQDTGNTRLRLVRHERSYGVAKARNTGLAVARGEWVAFLDDDDLWAPRKLRQQLDAANEDGASFVYGESILVDEAAQVVAADVPPPRPSDLPAALIQRNRMPAGCSNVVAKLGAVRGLGGFDEKLAQLADWDMWLRLSSTATGTTSPGVVVACRVHGGNMLLRDRRDVRREFDYLARKHHALASECGREFDPVAFAHWVAAGMRRGKHRWRAAYVHLAAATRYHDLRHLGCAVRAPLGDWAMELRQPAPPKAFSPPWLDRYRSDG